MTVQQLITEHLDIWTAAHKTRSSAGRGSSNKLELVGIKKLRELILELAVRGKLVPQDPNDEPASELLRRIDFEKARIAPNGKKENKNVSAELNKDDISFDAPRGWEWVKLGNVIRFTNGYAFKSSDFTDQGIGIVKIGDIQNGVLTPDTMSRVDHSVVENLDDSLRVEVGDLLIAMSGATTGKLGFNTSNEVFYLNQRVGKISPYLVSANYLYFPLTTKIAENLEKSLGSAIPNLSTAQINDIIFALPPLAEQHRIVAKVDELMAFCDQLEQTQNDNIEAHAQLVEALLATLTNSTDHKDLQNNWQRIATHFDTLFTTEHSIDQLKQTILQLAVIGKLVPQNPNDEPASILLKKIANEKEHLIKEGKIRKINLRGASVDLNEPFNVAPSWVWSTLGAISIRIIDGNYGQSYPAASEFLGCGIPFLTSAAIGEDGEILGEKVKFISFEKHTELAKAQSTVSDILLTNRGARAGAVGMLTENVYADCNIGPQITSIRVHNKFVLPVYVLRYMQSRIFLDMLSESNSGSAMNFVNLSKIVEMLLPIPPLQEQYRIVAKVEELMILCDTLKTNIQNAQATQLALTESLVEQAVN